MASIVILKHTSFWALDIFNFSPWILTYIFAWAHTPIFSFWQLFYLEMLCFTFLRRMNAYHSKCEARCSVEIFYMFMMFLELVYLSKFKWLTIVLTAYYLIQKLKSDVLNIFISTRVNLKAVLFTILTIFSIIFNPYVLVKTFILDIIL